MFLFRKIFLVLGLLALCSAPQAATVFGAGGSFSTYSGEPGVHLMAGFQGDLITISPKHLEIEGRALFSKLNFGAKNLDNLSVGAIGYTQTQLWNLRFGIHADIDYEVADYEQKDLNWTFGAELYKPTLLKNISVFNAFSISQLDLFLSGDIMMRGKDNPQTLGVVVLGVALQM